ncbi:MAG: hypothetical protein R3B96_03950 [Pirellulaceae bacterium]
MSSLEPPWSVEVKVPSVVDDGLAIIATILARLEELGWEPMDQFAVHLAARGSGRQWNQARQ